MFFIPFTKFTSANKNGLELDEYISEHYLFVELAELSASYNILHYSVVCRF